MSKLISIPDEMALEFDVIKQKVYDDRGIKLSYSAVIEKRYGTIKNRYNRLRKEHNKLKRKLKELK